MPKAPPAVAKIPVAEVDHAATSFPWPSVVAAVEAMEARLATARSEALSHALTHEVTSSSHGP